MKANASQHRNTRKNALWAAVLVVGGMSGIFGGCAYSGITSTPDGTVILARNSLLGANRKIYVCKVAGQELSCVENKASP